MTKAFSDCSKCKAPMPVVAPMRGPMGGFKFITTGYRCARCDHWNNLKSRKGFSEWSTSS